MVYFLGISCSSYVPSAAAILYLLMFSPQCLLIFQLLDLVGCHVCNLFSIVLMPNVRLFNAIYFPPIFITVLGALCVIGIMLQV